MVWSFDLLPCECWGSRLSETACAKGISPRKPRSAVRSTIDAIEKQCGDHGIDVAGHTDAGHHAATEHPTRARHERDLRRGVHLIRRGTSFEFGRAQTRPS